MPITYNDAHEAQKLSDDSPAIFLDELSWTEKRALEDDLGRAARIQQARLPEPGPCPAGWQSSFRYLSAGPVGGDYCDLFESAVAYSS
ncbi:MAG: hypothetical protein WDO73_29345 [Ignavibacteriota bacterium]